MSRQMPICPIQSDCGAVSPAIARARGVGGGAGSRWQGASILHNLTSYLGPWMIGSAKPPEHSPRSPVLPGEISLKIP